MIPKIINYCWFGNQPLPQNVKENIKTWRKYCPDYKIIQWNEKNFDVDSNLYTKQAYDRKKFAFVSDVARLRAVEDVGGIYFDTDVILLRSIDDILEHKSFFCLEEPGRINTGLGFGAEKNNILVNELLKNYDNQMFFDGRRENSKTCVDFLSPFFYRMGLEDKNKTQKLNETVVFSTEYFAPKNFLNGKMNITEKTYAVHAYEATWKEKTLSSRILLFIKKKIHIVIDSLFGAGSYRKIKKILKR